MTTLFPVGSHVVLQGLQEDASQYNGKVAIVESTVGECQRVRLLLDEDDDMDDDEDEQDEEEGKVLDVRPENLKATFYPIGSHVVLHGLQAASHHNEKIAIVESTVGERQRVRLLLLGNSNSNNEDESNKQFLDVKPENLTQAKFYPTGSRVILHGLQAASYYKYNGKIAVVVESLTTVGGGDRQRVRLMNNDDDEDTNEEGKVLDVRPKNLKANFHSIGIHVILHGLEASREQYNGKIAVVESTVGERQRVRLLLQDDDDDGNVSSSTKKVLNVRPENLKANFYPLKSRVVLQGLQGTSRYKYNGKIAIVESTVGERQRVRLLLNENDDEDKILHVWPENLKLAPQITETTAKQNLENIIKEQQQQQQKEEKNKKQKTKQSSRSTKEANNNNDDDCTECLEGICCCLCAILGVAAIVLAADSSKSPEPLPMPVRETTTPTSNSFYSGLRPVSSGYTTSPPYSQSMDRGAYNSGTHAAAHVSQAQSRQAAEEARAQEALRQAEAQYEETMRQCEFMNRATASASRMASHSMNIADQMRANRQQNASRMMNNMNQDQQATWDRIHGTRTGGRSSAQASWDRINDTINTMNPNVVYSHTYTSDL